MTNKAPEYNLATTRELLLAAFTAEELRRFCHDRPTFYPIVDRFGPEYGLDDMVDEVITYCEKHLLFDELLAEIKEYNPKQYARFAPRVGLATAGPVSLRKYVSRWQIQVKNLNLSGRTLRNLLIVLSVIVVLSLLTLNVVGDSGAVKVWVMGQLRI
jgi:hypothetical protein